MDIEKDTILNGNLSVTKTIKKQSDFYVYSALNLQNGNIYYVTEYYPEECARNDDGVVVLPYESMKSFDISVNKFIAYADEIISLGINRYLKIVTSFNEMGTGFVVTEKIDGISFKTLLEKKKSPLTIDEATPIYLDLLRDLADAASNHNIYFYIDPSTVYVTNESKIRLDYLYASNYDEKSATVDIAKLYYFMLSGFMPSENPPPIKTDNLRMNQIKLLEIVTRECKEEVYTSMKGFYEELFMIYTNKKTKKAIEKKAPNTNTKMVFITLSIAFVLIAVFAITSFFISGFVIGNPFLTPKTDAESGVLPPQTSINQIEFDIE